MLVSFRGGVGGDEALELVGADAQRAVLAAETVGVETASGDPSIDGDLRDVELAGDVADAKHRRNKHKQTLSQVHDV